MWLDTRRTRTPRKSRGRRSGLKKHSASPKLGRSGPCSSKLLQLRRSAARASKRVESSVGDLRMSVWPEKLRAFHVDGPVTKSSAFGGASNNTDVLGHALILQSRQGSHR